MPLTEDQKKKLAKMFAPHPETSVVMHYFPRGGKDPKCALCGKPHKDTVWYERAYFWYRLPDEDPDNKDVFCDGTRYADLPLIPPENLPPGWRTDG